MCLGDTAVSFRPLPPQPPTPTDQQQWCPVYHPIASRNLCDPSGPIQARDGAWHFFDDCFWCTADEPPFACPTGQGFMLNQTLLPLKHTF